MQWKRGVLVMATSMSGAFGATYAIGVPRTTMADDPSEVVAEQGEFPDGYTKIGALVASSKFVQDERVKAKWYVEIKVKNLTKEGPEKGQVEARVERDIYEPESRGMPLGTVVWHETESVEVPAGETIVIRRALPSAVSWGVYRYLEPAPEGSAPRRYGRTRTAYRTFIVDKEADEG